MKDTGKTIVRELFDLLEAHGVKNIVCSPGSRNMPLLMAADARPGIKKHIVIDERSAGFLGLGICQVSQSPVAIVCTSGTALLNYAPAVAEAYYQGLPLIVISADRPHEWIDQDDSQTIRQFEALSNFVKRSYDIDDRDISHDAVWYINRTVNDALITARRPKEGPVHINVHLSVPLDREQEIENPTVSNVRKISRHTFPTLPLRAESKYFAEKLIGKKVLLVAGFMQPDSVVNNQIRKFSRHSNVVIMAETLSNLHLHPECYVIDAAFSDVRSWDENYSNQLCPDIVISIGGALVSRRLKEYLRRAVKINPDIEHWSFGTQDYVVDCFKSLTLKIEEYPAPLIGQISAELAHLLKINDRLPVDSPDRVIIPDESSKFKERWTDLRKKSAEKLYELVKDSGWSELKMFNHLFDHIPGNWNLQLSNGTSVRYNQLLTKDLPHAVFCNRGVSGIDGSTSTAVGNSISSDIPTILVTGDMSASYDLGGLLAAQNLNSDIKIVVINNQGGSIFRFVKSTRNWESRDRYLCANPQTQFAGLADTFGFKYLSAMDYGEFTKAFDRMLNTPGRTLLEVLIHAEESNEILKDALNAK